MGTIADKLAKLNTTKEELKAALAEKGQTVGEVFSAYPAAVRAIGAGGAPTSVTIVSEFGLTNCSVNYIGVNGEAQASTGGTFETVGNSILSVKVSPKDQLDPPGSGPNLDIEGDASKLDFLLNQSLAASALYSVLVTKGPITFKIP